MGVGAGFCMYEYDVVVKSSRSLSHLLPDEFLLYCVCHFSFELVVLLATLPVVSIRAVLLVIILIGKV